MFYPTSIRARLIACFSISVVLVLGIAGFAALQILVLDRITESLDHKWLVGTRTLGEMADLLTELRLDDATLALATDESSTEQAVAAAARHIQSLEEESAEYATLPKDSE